MNLKEMYYKETGNQAVSYSFGLELPHTKYLDWLERLILNMKSCHNCKHSIFPYDDTIKCEVENCSFYSKWEPENNLEVII